MRSIATRLFWTQLVAIACLAAVVGVLLYVRVAENLNDQFDQALGGKATSLAALIRVGPQGVFADFDDRSLPEFSRRNHAHYLQVVDLDGHVVYKSRSLGKVELPATVGDHVAFYRNFELPNDIDGRLVTLKFAPTYDAADFSPGVPPDVQPKPLLLTFAQSREELDERLESFITALVAAALTMSVGIVIVTYFAVRSGLLHLRQFAGKVEQIHIDQLDSRIDDDGVPVELLPISMRVNEMLDRLKQAFYRERRFTADAAHELRTPIAELRTLAEVALRKSDSGQEEHQFFQDALGVAQQMESLVRALLMLARGQTSRDAGSLQLLDLSALVLGVWERTRPSRPPRGMTFNHDCPPGLYVMGDPTILTSIFTNLLGNALEYTPAVGTLDWRIESIDGQVRFTLENSNESLAPNDMPHLAEPFWRKNKSRSGNSHSGLGLALVKAWSDSIRADLRFELSPDARTFRTIVGLKQAAALSIPRPAETRDSVGVSE